MLALQRCCSVEEAAQNIAGGVEFRLLLFSKLADEDFFDAVFADYAGHAAATSF